MSQANNFVRELESYIASDRLSLPIFDPIAMMVQMELVKRDPDLRKVEKIITADQSLSSNILKIANSARYAGLVKTTTVRSAIIRLGTSEISSIVLMDLNRKNFLSRDPAVRVFLKQLWQHSVGCAFACGWLSRKLDFGVLQNEAFFSGLFHDVGKLVILLVIERRRKMNKKMKLETDILLQAMEIMHPQQGYQLMTHLGMPENSAIIARDHHLQEPDTENYLLMLVRMANIICHSMGISITGQKELEPAETREAAFLKLTEEEIQECIRFLEDAPSLLL